MTLEAYRIMVRFFYLFLLLSSATSLLAQGLLDNEVSLNEKNKSIEFILKSMETENLGFTYSSDLLDVKKRVSIQVKNETVGQVLKKLFAGQNVEFMTIGDQIIIKKKVIPKKEEPIEKATKVDTLVASSVNRKEVHQPTLKEQSSPSEMGNGKAKETEKSLSATGGRANEEQVSSNEKPLAVATVPVPTITWSLTSPTYQHQYVTSSHRVMSGTNNSVSSTGNNNARKAKKADPEPAEGPRFSGSVYTAITNIGNDAGTYIGARGLYYLTPEFGVGFGGGGFISPRYVDDVLSGVYRITGGYGGLLAEYSFRPMRKFHLNYHVLIAGGGAVYFKEDVLTGIQPDQLNTAVFVLEPGVTLELNILRWFRVGLDATYRFTSSGSVNYPNSDEIIFTTESLRGVNIGVSLKFGRF